MRVNPKIGMTQQRHKLPYANSFWHGNLQIAIEDGKRIIVIGMKPKDFEKHFHGEVIKDQRKVLNEEGITCIRTKNLLVFVVLPCPEIVYDLKLRLEAQSEDIREEQCVSKHALIDTFCYSSDTLIDMIDEDLGFVDLRGRILVICDSKTAEKSSDWFNHHEEEPIVCTSFYFFEAEQVVFAVPRFPLIGMSAYYLLTCAFQRGIFGVIYLGNHNEEAPSFGPESFSLTRARQDGYMITRKSKITNVMRTCVKSVINLESRWDDNEYSYNRIRNSGFAQPDYCAPFLAEAAENCGITFFGVFLKAKDDDPEISINALRMCLPSIPITKPLLPLKKGPEPGEECSICLEQFSEQRNHIYINQSCPHYVCQVCAKLSLSKCPMCNTPIKKL